MKPRKSVNAPAVDRALDIIELLAASERELALSEIVKRTHIPRQSLIRILNTLCSRGIVDRGEQRGFYGLGMKLLYLGNRLQDNIKLRSIARPFMQELADKSHKNIELSSLDQDQLVLVEQIEGTEGIRLYTHIGSAYPYFHAVAVGKIYLAHMVPEKRQKVLDKIGLPAVTEHTITDMNELETELLEVKKNGYAFEDQELRKGVRRVVAPIYDFRNDLAGCIGIAATLFSFELEDREYLGSLVMEAANKISNRMGKGR
ncbi:MAG TPA: IclR family transcriptional regulator [Desulfobacteraceae bacterium]|nr:IclR family transcriptional regulator [Desulfobacteraceae bacterium]